MPTPFGVLSSIPGYGAYAAQRQLNQQEGMQNLQQAGMLEGILSRQQANQREAALRGVLSQLPPDATPEMVTRAITPYVDAPTLMRTLQGSQDRAATIEAARINRQAALEQARSLQTERLQAQADLARQRAEDMRLTEADRRQAREDLLRLAAQLRPAPTPRPTEPLVQIVGPDGQPRWVERKDAIGKIPAAVGSKAEAKEAGKTDVDKDVMTLKSALDSLNAGGGITSTEQGVVPNIGRWASTTGPGQLLGTIGGTVNQKNRDVISQARPLLMRSIMNATGMSAKQIDSNAELKLWLSTATDPTKGYEANVEALNNIASKFGSGPIMDSAQTSGGKINPKPSRRADDVPAGLDPKIWAVMTPEEKRLFK